MHTYRPHLPIEHVAKACPDLRDEHEKRAEVHLEMGPHWHALGHARKLSQLLATGGATVLLNGVAVGGDA